MIGEYTFDPNPKNITLTCPECGTKFKPRSRTQKYCCVRCQKRVSGRIRRARKKANDD